MTTLQLVCLGAFDATLDGHAPLTLRTDKVRALLAYLALEPRPHRREELVGLFWPEQADSAALTNLRTSLHRLRQPLEAIATGMGDALFSIDRQTVTLNPGTFETDVQTFEDLVQACKTHAHRDLAGCDDCLARLAQATALYQDDLLAGFSVSDAPAFEEWLVLRREGLRQKLLSALNDLAIAHEDRAGEESQRYARRLLVLEPWREDAHRLLMRILAHSGQRSAALAQYHACRQVLAAEFGIEPDPETTALFEQIRSGKVRLLSRANANLPATSVTRHDWGEMPAMDVFHGRTAELAQLQDWLVQEQCRLVSILGIGGMGKTTLAAAATNAVVPHFEVLIWRSLLNAPPLAEILRDWLQVLSRHTVSQLPESFDERLRLLLDYLRQQRCLLVLDNVESILQSSQTNQPQAGEVRTGYESYATLFERLAVSEHRSCLLLTSREQPYVLARIGRETRMVRQLPLAGLDVQAGAAILQGSGLPASSQDAELLVKSYSGNPLALQIVANTIADFFDGDVAAFQREEGFLFDGIRAVLDQQFERLSELEREILVWLAIEREAVSVQALRANFVQSVINSALFDALNALQARTLLEKVGNGLTLQNVVIEYLTERLVSTICAEIAGAATQDQPTTAPAPHAAAWLHRFALSKAQAKEYVWQSQERLIVRPIFERLQKTLGQNSLVMKLQQILTVMHEQTATGSDTYRRGYVGGNILNLLLHTKVDLSAYDFSHLAVWQAYLRQGSFSHVNLAYADLAGSAYIKPYNTIWSVVYSSDNRWLAGGSMEGPIFIWQVEDGQAAAVYHGHSSVVYSLAFSPDNALLASGSQDQTIRLWDVRTGQTRFILHGQAGFVNSVAFSPDGALLASGSDAHAVQLWRVETGELITTLTGHGERVNCVVFGADGKTLASCGDDQTIRIWDIANGALQQTLHAQSRLHRIAYDSDAGLIISSGLSPTLQFWELATGECQETAPLYKNDTHLAVSSNRVLVTISQNRTWVASGSSGQNLHIWDTQTRTPLRVLHGHGDNVMGLAYSPDGQRLAAACENSTVCQWDVQTGALLQVFNGFGGRVDGLGFTASDELMVFSVQQGQILQWQARGGASRQSFSGSNALNRPLALCPDHSLLVCGDVNGIVSIWDWRAGRLAWQFEGHTKRISAFAAAYGGRLFATGSREDGVRIWDAQIRRLHQSVSLEDTNVCSLAFSPDQALLAIGSDSQTLLWETTQGRLLHTFTPDTDAPIGHNVAFSKDSLFLACGTGNRTIYIWDVATKQTRHIFQEHGGALFALAFSPDGTLLAAGCGDCYVYLWDVQQGQLRHRLGGHAGWVTQVVFVGDGSTLATGSYDGMVKLWAMDSGMCLDTYTPSGPYAGMNITGVTGISGAQKAALMSLGAIGD